MKNPFSLETLLPLLGMADAQEMTPAQRALMRKRHSSIFTSGVLVCSEAIIFTNESTLNNWRYYGGFEYVEKRHVTVVQQGEDFYLAVYSTNSDRVGDVQAELAAEVDEMVEVAAAA